MLDRSRRLVVMALAAIALAASRPAPAADVAARPPRAIAYAMWSDQLLFLAAKVDDVAITGAMSEAWRDDAVDFYLDMAGGVGDAVHPGCARLVVSAAGGFTALVGTDAGGWRAQPDWLMGLKVAVEREGTLNRSDDTDTGYTVEVGIPWRFLGGAPKPGRRIGFNFVVRVRGENETFVSFSSRVGAAEDLDRPDRWAVMALSPSARPAIAANDVIVCPVSYHPPLVDGRLGAGEWLTASVVQLDKPAPELVRQPAAGKPGGRLLATYRYDYRLAPTAGGAPPAGAEDALRFAADQPPDGLGPWFSAGSVAWHAGMLRQAREAAVDTILPVYRGDADARRTWSRLGLLRLAQALKDTKDGRMSYPLVGMYLDASSLPPSGAADLTAAAGRQALWGMIREFYSIVPEEFRAQFDAAGGDPAHVLVLGPPQGVTDWDRSCFDYCRNQFRRTFGARLLILGDEGWRAKAPNLDGYCSLRPGVGLSYGKEGPRPAARLSPGYLGPEGLLGRHGGHDYEQSWLSTLGVLPDFVIIDSLNDFPAATEIANSRQYGVRFLDLTRESAQVLAGRREYQVTLLRQTLPAVLNPGSTYDLELLVENQGFQDLTEANNVEISYTLQNKLRPDLRRTGVAAPRLFVRAGQRAPIVVSVSTATVDGPLPVGDYSLSFEVTKSSVPILRSRWFAKQLFEISLPVRLDRGPAHRARVLSTTLPSALGAGARKRVRVRLRNDGARAWRAKECSLSYHWVRMPGPGEEADAKAEAVEFEGLRSPLPRDVEPGKTVTMYARVEARTAGGAPLPAWTPDDDWTYQLQWDLVQGEDRWFSRLGSDAYAETVAVLASDLGATVVAADVPARMEAGQAYAVKVLLRNDGAAAWDPGHCRLVYHWHYWDGAAVARAESPTALGGPVAAGEAAQVTAQVTAPDGAGSYRLAWDLECDPSTGSGSSRARSRGDGRPASETIDAGPGAILVQPVIVDGGGYEPLDLSGQLNVVASTFAGHGARGAFDVATSSFPAEFLPPDASGAVLYPGAYFTGASGAEAPARVPLRYPPKDQRGASAIACTGQRIPLPPYPLRAIYLAAAASSPVTAQFRIAYPDGAEEERTLQVPLWTEPSPQDVIALRVPYLRRADGDAPVAAHIYLLRIGDLARADAPAALVLPESPHVKLFAITLERPPAATTGGS